MTIDVLMHKDWSRTRATTLSSPSSSRLLPGISRLRLLQEQGGQEEALNASQVELERST